MRPVHSSSLFAAFLTAAVAGIAESQVVSIQREGTQYVFASSSREIARYQAEPGPLPRGDIKPEFHRGAYLHPIYTPSGRLITDDYPPNHIHHHGAWFAWTKTAFEDRAPDFWNMGAKKGRVDFISAEPQPPLGAFARLIANHRYIDMLAEPEKAALDETWDIRVAARPADGTAPEHFIIDLACTQRCATQAPLRLPKYHYGGFGFRGNWAWNGPDAWRVLTSEGATDRIKANQTRGKWCWLGGEVDGAIAGITILCASENFRAPQPMRIHPTEPFFSFAPQQLGEMEIPAAQPYVSRYRLIVADGQPTREQAAAWWSQWSQGTAEK
jgi:hypothetical protein